MKKLEKRQWLKRLGVIVRIFLVVAITLSFLAWRGLVWYTEQASSFSGTPLPMCGSITGGEQYAQAVGVARDQIQAMMVEREIPGLAAAVSVDGKLVWSEGFGYADREKLIQACPQTQFRIGSVSKSFTAAALGQLYEQGRIKLDVPIQTYVPSFPDKGSPITVQQLATHQSGIRHYRDDMETVTTKRCSTMTEGLDAFQNDPLLFVPGTDFFYTSYGFNLLAAAIEGASGQDFATYMRQHVYEPLRLSHTIENRLEQPAPQQSKFYDNVTPYSLDGKVHESPPIDFSCKWASGGLLSTAEDLVRFGSSHISPFNAGFLKDETINFLMTPRSGLFGIIGYGMGWGTARDLHLRLAHFHFGATSGGTAFLAVFPEQRASIAILANLGHARFAMERLFHLVNAFVPDPSLPLVVGVGVIISTYWFLITVWFVRKIRTKRK